MSTIVEHRKFVFCRAGNADWQPCGANKVWEIILHDNNDVETRFGKIGTTLQTNVKSGVGRSFFDKKIKEKTKPSSHYDGECYREIKTLDTEAVSGSAPVNATAKNLQALAVKQIAANCPLTAKLITYFTKVNAHQIYEASGGKITYDTSSGTFKTPVGVVVQENVDEARTLLHKTLAPYVKKKDTSNIKFVRALEQYLMLIPKDIGRRFDASAILGTQSQVQEQDQILDALDASIKSIVTVSAAPDDKADKKTKDEPKLFSVKMKIIDDKSEISRIQKFFDKTRNSMHKSARMTVQTAYSVDIETMTSAFERIGAKMTNIWELWHGTKASNCLSILKSGFFIPDENASFCTGRAFGNGVYFSDQSTKSLNYATNFWGGSDEGRYFMFLNQIAMGKMYKATHTFDDHPPDGYDSTFAEAGKSGFLNSEMIVYKLSQILPTHLIEFG